MGKKKSAAEPHEVFVMNNPLHRQGSNVSTASAASDSEHFFQDTKAPGRHTPRSKLVIAAIVAVVVVCAIVIPVAVVFGRSSSKIVCPAASASTSLGTVYSGNYMLGATGIYNPPSCALSTSSGEISVAWTAPSPGEYIFRSSVAGSTLYVRRLTCDGSLVACGTGAFLSFNVTAQDVGVLVLVADAPASASAVTLTVERTAIEVSGHMTALAGALSNPQSGASVDLGATTGTAASSGQASDSPAISAVVASSFGGNAKLDVQNKVVSVLQSPTPGEAPWYPDAVYPVVVVQGRFTLPGMQGQFDGQMALFYQSCRPNCSSASMQMVMDVASPMQWSPASIPGVDGGSWLNSLAPTTRSHVIVSSVAHVRNETGVIGSGGRRDVAGALPRMYVGPVPPGISFLSSGVLDSRGPLSPLGGVFSDSLFSAESVVKGRIPLAGEPSFSIDTNATISSGSPIFTPTAATGAAPPGTTIGVVGAGAQPQVSLAVPASINPLDGLQFPDLSAIFGSTFSFNNTNGTISLSARFPGPIVLPLFSGNWSHAATLTNIVFDVVLRLSANSTFPSLAAIKLGGALSVGGQSYAVAGAIDKDSGDYGLAFAMERAGTLSSALFGLVDEDSVFGSLQFNGSIHMSIGSRAFVVGNTAFPAGVKVALNAQVGSSLADRLRTLNRNIRATTFAVSAVFPWDGTGTWSMGLAVDELWMSPYLSMQSFALSFASESERMRVSGAVVAYLSPSVPLGEQISASISADHAPGEDFIFTGKMDGTWAPAAQAWLTVHDASVRIELSPYVFGRVRLVSIAGAAMLQFGNGTTTQLAVLASVSEGDYSLRADAALSIIDLGTFVRGVLGGSSAPAWFSSSLTLKGNMTLAIQTANTTSDAPSKSLFLSASASLGADMQATLSGLGNSIKSSGVSLYLAMPVVGATVRDIKLTVTASIAELRISPHLRLVGSKFVLNDATTASPSFAVSTVAELLVAGVESPLRFEVAGSVSTDTQTVVSLYGTLAGAWSPFAAAWVSLDSGVVNATFTRNANRTLVSGFAAVKGTPSFSYGAVSASTNLDMQIDVVTGDFYVRVGGIVVHSMDHILASALTDDLGGPVLSSTAAVSMGALFDVVVASRDYPGIASKGVVVHGQAVITGPLYEPMRHLNSELARGDVELYIKSPIKPASLADVSVRVSADLRPVRLAESVSIANVVVDMERLDAMDATLSTVVQIYLSDRSNPLVVELQGSFRNAASDALATSPPGTLVTSARMHGRVVGAIPFPNGRGLLKIASATVAVDLDVTLGTISAANVSFAAAGEISLGSSHVLAVSLSGALSPNMYDYAFTATVNASVDSFLVASLLSSAATLLSNTSLSIDSQTIPTSGHVLTAQSTPLSLGSAARVVFSTYDDTVHGVYEGVSIVATAMLSGDTFSPVYAMHPSVANSSFGLQVAFSLTGRYEPKFSLRCNIGELCLREKACVRNVLLDVRGRGTGVSDITVSGSLVLAISKSNNHPLVFGITAAFNSTSGSVSGRLSFAGASQSEWNPLGATWLSVTAMSASFALQFNPTRAIDVISVSGTCIALLGRTGDAATASMAVSVYSETGDWTLTAVGALAADLSSLTSTLWGSGTPPSVLRNFTVPFSASLNVTVSTHDDSSLGARAGIVVAVETNLATSFLNVIRKLAGSDGLSAASAVLNLYLPSASSSYTNAELSIGIRMTSIRLSPTVRLVGVTADVTALNSPKIAVSSVLEILSPNNPDVVVFSTQGSLDEIVDESLYDAYGEDPLLYSLSLAGTLVGEWRPYASKWMSISNAKGNAVFQTGGIGVSGATLVSAAFAGTPKFSFATFTTQSRVVGIARSNMLDFSLKSTGVSIASLSGVMQDVVFGTANVTAAADVQRFATLGEFSVVAAVNVSVATFNDTFSDVESGLIVDATATLTGGVLKSIGSLGFRVPDGRVGMKLRMPLRPQSAADVTASMWFAADTIVVSDRLRFSATRVTVASLYPLVMLASSQVDLVLGSADPLSFVATLSASIAATNGSDIVQLTATQTSAWTPPGVGKWLTIAGGSLRATIVRSPIDGRKPVLSGLVTCESQALLTLGTDVRPANLYASASLVADSSTGFWAVSLGSIDSDRFEALFGASTGSTLPAPLYDALSALSWDSSMNVTYAAYASASYGIDAGLTVQVRASLSEGAIATLLRSVGVSATKGTTLTIVLRVPTNMSADATRLSLRLGGGFDFGTSGLVSLREVVVDVSRISPPSARMSSVVELSLGEQGAPLRVRIDGLVGDSPLGIVAGEIVSATGTLLGTWTPPSASWLTVRSCYANITFAPGRRPWFRGARLDCAADMLVGATLVSTSVAVSVGDGGSGFSLRVAAVAIPSMSSLFAAITRSSSPPSWLPDMKLLGAANITISTFDAPFQSIRAGFSLVATVTLPTVIQTQVTNLNAKATDVKFSLDLFAPMNATRADDVRFAFGVSAQEIRLSPNVRLTSINVGMTQLNPPTVSAQTAVEITTGNSTLVFLAAGTGTQLSTAASRIVVNGTQVGTWRPMGLQWIEISNARLSMAVLPSGANRLAALSLDGDVRVVLPEALIAATADARQPPPVRVSATFNPSTMDFVVTARGIQVRSMSDILSVFFGTVVLRESTPPLLADVGLQTPSIDLALASAAWNGAREGVTVSSRVVGMGSVLEPINAMGSQVPAADFDMSFNAPLDTLWKRTLSALANATIDLTGVSIRVNPGISMAITDIYLNVKNLLVPNMRVGGIATLSLKDNPYPLKVSLGGMYNASAYVMALRGRLVSSWSPFNVTWLNVTAADAYVEFDLSDDAPRVLSELSMNGTLAMSHKGIIDTYVTTLTFALSVAQNGADFWIRGTGTLNANIDVISRNVLTNVTINNTPQLIKDTIVIGDLSTTVYFSTFDNGFEGVLKGLTIQVQILAPNSISTALQNMQNSGFSGNNIFLANFYCSVNMPIASGRIGDVKYKLSYTLSAPINLSPMLRVYYMHVDVTNIANPALNLLGVVETTVFGSKAPLRFRVQGGYTLFTTGTQLVTLQGDLADVWKPFDAEWLSITNGRMYLGIVPSNSSGNKVSSLYFDGSARFQLNDLSAAVSTRVDVDPVTSQFALRASGLGVASISELIRYVAGAYSTPAILTPVTLARPTVNVSIASSGRFGVSPGVTLDAKVAIDGDLLKPFTRVGVSGLDGRNGSFGLSLYMPALNTTLGGVQVVLTASIPALALSSTVQLSGVYLSLRNLFRPVLSLGGTLTIAAGTSVGDGPLVFSVAAAYDATDAATLTFAGALVGRWRPFGLTWFSIDACAVSAIVQSATDDGLIRAAAARIDFGGSFSLFNGSTVGMRFAGRHGPGASLFWIRATVSTMSDLGRFFQSALGLKSAPSFLGDFDIATPLQSSSSIGSTLSIALSDAPEDGVREGVSLVAFARVGGETIKKISSLGISVANATFLLSCRFPLTKPNLTNVEFFLRTDVKEIRLSSFVRFSSLLVSVDRLDNPTLSVSTAVDVTLPGDTTPLRFQVAGSLAGAAVANSTTPFTLSGALLEPWRPLGLDWLTIDRAVMNISGSSSRIARIGVSGAATVRLGQSTTAGLSVDVSMDGVTGNYNITLMGVAVTDFGDMVRGIASWGAGEIPAMIREFRLPAAAQANLSISTLTGYSISVRAQLGSAVVQHLSPFGRSGLPGIACTVTLSMPFASLDPAKLRMAVMADMTDVYLADHVRLVSVGLSIQGLFPPTFALETVVDLYAVQDDPDVPPLRTQLITIYEQSRRLEIVGRLVSTWTPPHAAWLQIRGADVNATFVLDRPDLERRVSFFASFATSAGGNSSLASGATVSGSIVDGPSTQVVILARQVPVIDIGVIVAYYITKAPVTLYGLSNPVDGRIDVEIATQAFLAADGTTFKSPGLYMGASVTCYDGILLMALRALKPESAQFSSRINLYLPVFAQPDRQADGIWLSLLVSGSMNSLPGARWAGLELRASWDSLYLNPTITLTSSLSVDIRYNPEPLVFYVRAQYVSQKPLIVQGGMLGDWRNPFNAAAWLGISNVSMTLVVDTSGVYTPTLRTLTLEGNLRVAFDAANPTILRFRGDVANLTDFAVAVSAVSAKSIASILPVVTGRAGAVPAMVSSLSNIANGARVVLSTYTYSDVVGGISRKFDPGFTFDVAVSATSGPMLDLVNVFRVGGAASRVDFTGGVYVPVFDSVSKDKLRLYLTAASVASSLTSRLQYAGLYFDIQFDMFSAAPSVYIGTQLSVLFPAGLDYKSSNGTIVKYQVTGAYTAADGRLVLSGSIVGEWNNPLGLGNWLSVRDCTINVVIETRPTIQMAELYVSIGAAVRFGGYVTSAKAEGRAARQFTGFMVSLSVSSVQNLAAVVMSITNTASVHDVIKTLILPVDVSVFVTVSNYDDNALGIETGVKLGAIVRITSGIVMDAMRLIDKTATDARYTLSMLIPVFDVDPLKIRFQLTTPPIAFTPTFGLLGLTLTVNIAAPPTVSASTGIYLNLTNNPVLQFWVEGTFKTYGSVVLSGGMKGMWLNAFGVPGLSIGNVVISVEFGQTYGVGLGGMVVIGNVGISLYGRVTWPDMRDLFFAGTIANNVTAMSFADLALWWNAATPANIARLGSSQYSASWAFRSASFYFAPMDGVFNQIRYRAGFGVRAEMTVFGYILSAEVVIGGKNLGWIKIPDVSFTFVFASASLSQQISNTLGTQLPGSITDLSDLEKSQILKEYDVSKPFFSLERFAITDFSFSNIATGRLPTLQIDFYLFGKLRNIDFQISIPDIFKSTFGSIMSIIRQFFKLPQCIRDADCFNPSLCVCEAWQQAKGACPDGCYGDCSFFRCTYG